LRLAGKLLGEHPVGGGFIFAIAEVPMSMANMALVPQAAVASEPNSGDLDAASRQDPPLQKQDETFRNARDFIITTSESKFLVHTRDNPSSGPVEFRSGRAKVG
jgi:hypothetical protein